MNISKKLMVIVLVGVNAMGMSQSMHAMDAHLGDQTMVHFGAVQGLAIGTCFLAIGRLRVVARAFDGLSGIWCPRIGLARRIELFKNLQIAGAALIGASMGASAVFMVLGK